MNGNGMENFWKETVEGKNRTFIHAVFYVFLVLGSKLYGWMSLISRVLRERKKVSVGARVISVGNITVGGTGKTQLIETLAKTLCENNVRFAVLCHGYKAKKKALQPFVNLQGSASMGIEEAGDEAFYLSRQFSDTPVLVGRNRVENARLLLERYPAQVLLLDDAFQYTGMRRDMDIALVDAMNPAGNGRLFPAGILREPLSSLSRATLVVLSKANFVSPQERERIKNEFIRPYAEAPILEMHIFADRLRNVCSGEECSLEELSHKHVLVFCGIGSPESFVKTVQQCKPASIESYFFPDHYDYTKTDIGRMFDHAVREGREMMVTTEKDAVKFSVTGKPVVPVYSLKAKVVLQPDITECKEFLSILGHHAETL